MDKLRNGALTNDGDDTWKKGTMIVKNILRTLEKKTGIKFTAFIGKTFVFSMHHGKMSFNLNFKQHLMVIRHIYTIFLSLSHIYQIFHIFQYKIVGF